jgi:hypothetical protein
MIKDLAAIPCHAFLLRAHKEKQSAIQERRHVLLHRLLLPNKHLNFEIWTLLRTILPSYFQVFLHTFHDVTGSQ